MSREETPPRPSREGGRGWLAALWFAVLIAVAALHLAPTGYRPSAPHEDKILHGLVMLPLAFALPWRMTPARAVWTFAGFAALAGLLELGQKALPTGRQADLLDWLGGACGAAAGAALRLGLESWRSRRNTK